MPACAGIDLGGSKIIGAALEEGRVVAYSDKYPTPPEPSSLLDAISRCFQDLASKVDVVALGLGVPGMVDPDGLLVFSPNLPQGERINFNLHFAKELGVPVAVDNDANCAAYGELAYGAAAGADHAVVVTLGTGIGGGVVVGGKVLRGAFNFAGEVGHMVVNPFGPLCPCGKRGCWERYASGSGLARMARQRAEAGRLSVVAELAGGELDAIRGEHVTQAAASGDPEATALLEEFGWWVALGLANLCAVLDPELIVLGGGAAMNSSLWLDVVRTALAEHLEGAQARRHPRISPAQLGQLAGAVGAAALAAEAVSA